MAKAIDILLVEDSPDDEALLVRELRSAGFAFQCRRVECEVDYLAGLDQAPDVIISDFNLPEFTFARALELLRARQLEIPLIVVSGTIGEVQAVECIKAGATDYILKDRLQRLGPAIRRALRENVEKRARRQAEEQLRIQATALENAADAIFITDARGTIVWTNPAFLTLSGYDTNEVVGQNPRLLKSGMHDGDFYRRVWETILVGHTWRGEFTNRRKDGSLYFGEQSITPVRADHGSITHFVGIMNDVTERKRAEESLNLFRALIDRSNDGFELVDPATGRYLDVNLTSCERHGYTRAEMLALRVQDLEVAAVDETSWSAHVANIQRAGFVTAEGRHRRKDGSTFPVEVNVSYIRLDRDYLVAVVRDITERKQAEQQRADELNYSRTLLAASPAGIITYRADGQALSANETAARLIGGTVAELQAQNFRTLQSWRQTGLRDAAERVLQTGREEELEFRGTTTFGRDVWLWWRFVRFQLNAQVNLLAFFTDLSARRQAEQALQQSEARFRELAETVEEVFWITDPAKRQMLYISPAYERIWGRTCASLYSQPQSWLEAIHADDRERVFHAAQTKQVAGSYDEEYRIRQPDGAERWIRDRAFPVRNHAGAVERVVGVAQDITERRQLEGQLRQSQKMEAVGQLAGGVAHDFNNILTAILMHLGLFRGQPGLPEGTLETVHELEAEVRRATNLTRQLLLFSRRQVIQPRELDLNEVVTSLAKMLQRIIGEDVKLQLHLHAAPLRTRADAGMLDQVLLNLAVNARDAMPDGGRLLIETNAKTVDPEWVRLHPDASPGPHVWLSVSDTGTGIPKEIITRIFEPFFTTKAPGKGTGLGLATVFGIVKQHRGWIKVYSEPGQGANFQVFLPASLATVEAAAAAERSATPRGGTETILLVEDENRVRVLTRLILERAGYRVLEAPHGVAALQVWEKEGAQIQLLLTDMVMPEGMSGRQLAQQLREKNPKLRVVFASGYSAEIAGRELILQPGQNFIQKPCSPAELLTTVRQCLDH